VRVYLRVSVSLIFVRLLVETWSLPQWVPMNEVNAEVLCRSNHSREDFISSRVAAAAAATTATI